MAHRIKQLIAPVGIYQKVAYEVTGYITHHKSRFVTFKPDDAKSWTLAARKCGGLLGAALPTKCTSRAQVLAAIEAIENNPGLHLEWMDKLAEVTPETDKTPDLAALDERDRADMRAVRHWLICDWECPK